MSIKVASRFLRSRKRLLALHQRDLSIAVAAMVASQYPFDRQIEIGVVAEAELDCCRKVRQVWVLVVRLQRMTFISKILL